MYEASEADIIQVLRTSPKSEVMMNETKQLLAASNPDTDHHDEVVEATTEQVEATSIAPTTVHLSPSRPTKRNALLTDYFKKLPPKKKRVLKDASNCDENAEPKNTQENRKNGVDNRQVEPVGTNNSNHEGLDQESNFWGGKKQENASPEGSRKDVVMTNSLGPSAQQIMEIAVSRISLNDEFNHLANWNSVILPKLRKWTDAVYRVRRSDELRYRLLSSLALAQSAEHPRKRRDHVHGSWSVVFEQCDFLREGYSGECYRREISALNY
jgi:hypothetical protein